MRRRLRSAVEPLGARRAVLLLFACAAVAQGVSAVLAPRGDLLNHVEWARRLLGGRFLYDGGLNVPYPPAWALVHVPLVPLPPRVAAGVTFLAGLAATALLLAVLHRMLRPSGLTREELFGVDVAALLLSSRFLLRDLADGGPNVTLLALTFSGLLLWARGRDAAGGALVGVAFALKATPGLFLAWLAWRRQWRAAAAGLLAAAAVTAAPALLMGPASFARHAATWASNVSRGIATADPAVGVLGPEAAGNVALRPVLGRLVGLSPAAASAASALAALALLAGTAWAFRRPLPSRHSPGVPVELAAVALLALLLSPVAWRSHAVAVLPGLVVLGQRAVLRGRIGRPSAALLGAWVLVVLVLNRAVVGDAGVARFHGLGLYTALLLGLLALLLAEHGRPLPPPRRRRDEGGEEATPGPKPVTVVVPTYDEAENLPVLARRLLALPCEPRLVVVDDASPDGTGDVAEALARENPGRVEVVHRAGKLGLGSAHLAGIQRALRSGAERIVTMDADLSHPPETLPALLEASGRAVVVVGSRYVPGGRAVDSPFLRRLLSLAANVAARTLLGLSTRDATAGFRVYRRSAAERLLAAGIVSSGYSFAVESTLLFEERGDVVEEVPILFLDRRHGTSKVSRGEIGKAVATLARLAGRRARRFLGFSAAGTAT